MDKMQGHRKHLASHSNCEAPQCFIAIRSLKQYGKVKVALLHVIIAQKKNQAAVFIDLSRKRGNSFHDCSQIVHDIFNLSPLGGRHTRITRGNPA